LCLQSVLFPDLDSDGEFAMTIGPGTFVCILLSSCLSACNLSPHRPDGVPASAIYADDTFVECSFVQQSNANLCTVYKDDTGEILAEALFVLDGTQRAAQQSELHYAGFGHRVIYLKNGRRLVPRDAIEASERDPTNRVIRDRLKDLSGGHAAKAIDCGRVVLPLQVERPTDSPSECALRTFAARKAFCVRFYHDHYNSIRFQGFAGDRKGNLYEVDYDDLGWNGALLPKETQLLDGGLTVVMACPKPSALIKTFDGKLACSGRAAGQNSRVIENRELSPVLSIEELLANRRSYAHTLVTVRGCYINGEELSALTKCSPEDQSAQRNEIIWVEQASDYEIPSAIRAKLPLSYLSDPQLVFNYRAAKDLQPWKRLRIGEVVLFGQFETTDWRDEPTEGGFGHVGAYSHQLILVDVLGAADRGRFH
jgi:hypothetical protein